jgi:hypothetical protein
MRYRVALIAALGLSAMLHRTSRFREHMFAASLKVVDRVPPTPHPDVSVSICSRPHWSPISSTVSGPLIGGV